MIRLVIFDDFSIILFLNVDWILLDLSPDLLNYSIRLNP